MRSLKKSGIYNCCFYREGVRIDTAVLRAGIIFYTEKYTNMTTKDSATLTARDIKNAGWVFSESVFLKDPVDVIVMASFKI